MHKVFISYAHADGAEASRLVSVLGDLKIAGWQDASDIAGGEPIASAVRSALEQASAVIVLVSPESLRSRWVQFEIGAAEALGKAIIPVLIAGDDVEQELPQILSDRSWVDARHRPAAEVAAELRAALDPSDS